MSFQQPPRPESTETLMFQCPNAVPHFRVDSGYDTYLLRDHLNVSHPVRDVHAVVSSE